MRTYTVTVPGLVSVMAYREDNAVPMSFKRCAGEWFGYLGRWRFIVTPKNHPETKAEVRRRKEATGTYYKDAA